MYHKYGRSTQIILVKFWIRTVSFISYLYRKETCDVEYLLYAGLFFIFYAGSRMAKDV